MYYLGIMSGTSLDGVDIALASFDSQGKGQCLAADCFPFPERLRQQLLDLHSGQVHLQQLGELDQQLALLYADVVQQFLSQQQLSAQQIYAIGCHGQTIWHSPQGPFPFTMQIGDMNLLAAKTGITTIGDFRRKDMAWGGQGAPLVPAFHQGCFAHPERLRVVLNMGGISNISVLMPNQNVIGYDTGPANALLDAWIEQHLQQPYDKNGQWAASGKLNEGLLQALLAEPYFALPAPKSTGRELFNLPWLEKVLKKWIALSPSQPPLAPEDVQATLVALTVQSIVQELNKIQTDLAKDLLLCGGGAKNMQIVEGLKRRLPDWQLSHTSDWGLDGDYVEAMAFAWLAYCRLQQLPSNLPSVTGAQRAVSLGAIYPKDDI